MIEVSISVEGQMGLTWPLWKRWVAMVDANGFAGLYRSDHFTMPAPPDRPSLECIVSLTYLASHTRRVQFGPLVSPLSFRDPVMLARQAAALDDLSEGRMVLGIGAGWMEREHRLFGYALGDMDTRYARWEEGLEVVTRLLRSEEPVSYQGQFYQLQEARLLPRPQRPGGPKILVGGSGRKKTLALVARYADVWNATSTGPDAFRKKSEALDKLLLAQGRQLKAVKRTVAALGLFGHTEDALARRMQLARRWDAELAALPLQAAVEKVNTEWNAVAGLPDRALEQIRAYDQAGVDELILQWFDVEDVDGAEAFARLVLSRL